MSISTRSPKTRPSPAPPSRRVTGRLWRAPRSKTWWLSLLAAVLLYGLLLLYFIKAGGFHDDPYTLYGVLPRFGLVALALLAVPLAYTVRRRFFRALPGKTRDWLWVHTWGGIVVLLTVMLHANFYYVARGYCYSAACLSPVYGGPIALDGLFLLVTSGIVGRLLDWRLARTITKEASSNGAGIVEAVQERLRELEYMVERLYAGKSETFKQYCLASLGLDGLPPPPPHLAPHEQADLVRAIAALTTRARLLRSLDNQQHARRLMRRWRAVHITLACTGIGGIGLHLGWLALRVLSARFHLTM